MFFNDRLVSIKNARKILEVGPGGTPHELSTEFLDIDPSTFKDEREALLQRGSAPALKTNKPITFYDGKIFPFDNKSFDYVIASHVLEHVDNVEQFIAELLRVGSAGYIEYPTILYDYLYNIPVHLNFLHFNKDENTVYYYKKTDTHLSEFQELHNFMLKTLDNGHTTLVDSLKNTMFEGFEWGSNYPLKVMKATNIHQIMPAFEDITKFTLPVERVIETREVHINNGPGSLPTKSLFKELAKRVPRKIKHTLKRRLPN